MKIAEQQLRHQGLKPQCTSRRIIVEMADEVLAKRRGELIAEAAEIVEQWRAKGFRKASGRHRKSPHRARENQQ